MKKLSSSQKISMAITSIGAGIGIILLIAVFTVGNNNIAARPFFTVAVKIYVSLVPVLMIVLAVVRQRDVVLTSILAGILFLFCLCFLILPMIIHQDAFSIL